MKESFTQMWTRKIVQSLLASYKVTLSPWLGERCRFHPTCSEYLAESVIRFGCLRGFALGTFRVCRCQPWCAGGFDPVPEKAERSSILLGGSKFRFSANWLCRAYSIHFVPFHKTISLIPEKIHS